MMETCCESQSQRLKMYSQSDGFDWPPSAGLTIFIWLDLSAIHCPNNKRQATDILLRKRTPGADSTATEDDIPILCITPSSGGMEGQVFCKCGITAKLTTKTVLDYLLFSWWQMYLYIVVMNFNHHVKGYTPADEGSLLLTIVIYSATYWDQRQTKSSMVLSAYHAYRWGSTECRFYVSGRTPFKSLRLYRSSEISRWTTYVRQYMREAFLSPDA